MLADRADSVEGRATTRLDEVHGRSARLTPDAIHRVVVEVVRGDPRNLRYALLVRTSTRMP